VDGGSSDTPRNSLEEAVRSMTYNDSDLSLISKIQLEAQRFLDLIAMGFPPVAVCEHLGLRADEWSRAVELADLIRSHTPDHPFVRIMDQAIDYGLQNYGRLGRTIYEAAKGDPKWAAWLLEKYYDRYPVIPPRKAQLTRISVMVARD